MVTCVQKRREFAAEVRILSGVKTLARKQLLGVIRAVPDFWQAQAKRSNFNTAQS
jgi:hypothetical protein